MTRYRANSKKDIIGVKEEREKAVASSELGHESYGGHAQGRRFHWIGLDCGLNYSWNLILKLLSSNYSGHAGASTTFKFYTIPHIIYVSVSEFKKKSWKLVNRKSLTWSNRNFIIFKLKKWTLGFITDQKYI